MNVPTGQVFFHRKLEDGPPDVYPACAIDVDIANKCYVVRTMGAVVPYPKEQYTMEHREAS